MGGNGKKSSSLQCCLCFGTSNNIGEDEEADWEPPSHTRKIRPSDEDRRQWVGQSEADWEPPSHTRKIRPSDEDRRQWVGQSEVDKKASDFIARFYASRSTDSEHQTVLV